MATWKTVPVAKHDDPAALATFPPAEDGAALVDAVPTTTAAPAGTLYIEVPLGRRVMVVGDVLLPPTATASSRALAGDLARVLDDWQGPGVVIVCGNLFAAPPGARGFTADHARSALAAHEQFEEAVRSFTGRPDRRLLVLPGWRDPGVDEPAIASMLHAFGAETTPAVDLTLVTASGPRRVLVRPGTPPGGASGVADTAPVSERPWLAGIERLEDPTAAGPFVTSRTLYRRLGKFAAVPLLPALVALLLRLAFVVNGLEHLFGVSSSKSAISHAYGASWPERVLVAGAITIVVLVVFAAVVAFTSRGIWSALGGQALPKPWPARRRHPRGDEPTDREQTSAHRRGDVVEEASSGTLQVDGRDSLDEARALIAQGARGLIAGGGLRAELTHLDPGFYACPGATTELVREHRGHAGLPPVFLHHRQVSWLELETGAELHVRLLLADGDLPTSTLLERLATGYRVVKGYKPATDLHPAMVASWPVGAGWPPPADAAAERTRTRRVRRWSAAALFIAGLVDLLSAITPPLRGHLQAIRQVLPLGVAEAAGALVALSGIGLMMLARGVLRGQRRSWLAAVCVLTATLVFHLAHDAAITGLLVTALVLLVLLVEHDRFGAATDRGSLPAAGLTLVCGVIAAVLIGTIAIEVTGRVGHHALPGWPSVLLASTERLVGLDTVSLPDRIDDWVYPSLLAAGIGLALLTLYMLTRPVVDRRLSAGRLPRRRAAELRARDIVRRHGSGTLDYFALRDDKQWFFHRDSLVAYAVYGGICLVSPDPIGPLSERAHVWAVFRQFCDRHGWGVAVMAAAEEWLPVYRDVAMGNIYIGDEAVVDVQRFSLDGGKMKGLRQAVNRVARNGYRVEFLDPARVTPELAGPLVQLMAKHRRGEAERGFSMMLGRIFDRRDNGLLLTVVYGPDGRPAAMCQFVPSRAIDGYSLDLMRRDPGEHPNGLLDFALCSTIDHLRERGQRGLSLNFAAMRSTLEGETADRLTHRVERWALRRMSGILQIESLWRFNAKYEPSWLPRYIVYDSAEHFAATVVAILRAESLSEVPVVGRLLASPAGRHSGPVVPPEIERGGAGSPAAEPRETESPAAVRSETRSPATGPPATDQGPAKPRADVSPT